MVIVAVAGLCLVPASLRRRRQIYTELFYEHATKELEYRRASIEALYAGPHIHRAEADRAFRLFYYHADLRQKYFEAMGSAWLPVPPDTK